MPWDRLGEQIYSRCLRYTYFHAFRIWTTLGLTRLRFIRRVICGILPFSSAWLGIGLASGRSCYLPEFRTFCVYEQLQRVFCLESVSYTHLTLPTKRIV